MIVVSDTSPISNLIQIGRLGILKDLYHNIIIPPFVDKEIRKLEDFGFDVQKYRNAEWIEIYNPKNTELVNKLEEKLDKGESQAIVICKELEANLIIIDERLGTRIAHEHGLNTIGLIGCLILAKNKSIIKEVSAIIYELESIAGFYIDKKLKERVLELAKE